MRNRHELLEKKAQEILENISEWAREELCLKPEEHIAITLRVERTVTVVEAPRKSIMDTPIFYFFSPQRCIDIVGSKSLSAKIRNRLTEESPFWESPRHDRSINLKTLGDLVVFGRTRLLEIEYIGKGVVAKIERMLATVDLKLDA